ncbi:MAG: thiamine-phosphate kinase [Hyphomicrobiales bacterium]|nr:thiamine-phosphate kinase [Hyphomicrobiales bacterium]
MAERISEDDLIARYLAPIAGAAGLRLVDDAALFAPPAGRDLVLTKDALVAGVHFFPEDAPDDIARKALRVNLSDLAAKGARPEGFLLALALPADFSESWIARFAQGLGEDARAYACALFGGDTVSTPGPLTLSITALGSVEQGRMVLRSGARAGDALYVSGTIGDAALGLRLRRDTSGSEQLTREESAFLLRRYLRPEPRVALAEALARHASGAMDVSDGLVGDLAKMMRASAVAAQARLPAIPLSAAARRLTAARPEALAAALTGGDDYEILASVPQDACVAFEDAARAAGVAVARIGSVQAGEGVVITDAAGAAMRFAQSSYSHF